MAPAHLQQHREGGVSSSWHILSCSYLSSEMSKFRNPVRQGVILLGSPEQHCAKPSCEEPKSNQSLFSYRSAQLCNTDEHPNPETLGFDQWKHASRTNVSNPLLSCTIQPWRPQIDLDASRSLPCARFSYAHLSACLSLLSVTLVLQVTVISSRTNFTHTRGTSTTWSFAYCVLPKIDTSHRAMPYVTSRFLTFLGSSFRWASALRRCTSTWAWFMAEPTYPIGYEPKDHKLFTEDKASLWIPGSCWTRGFTCITTILPSTEHSFDLRFWR